MWAKLGHSEWRKTLELKETSRQVRVLRVGRRNKWIKSEKDYSKANVLKLIEKILGGDSRSKALRQGLPSFTEDL